MVYVQYTDENLGRRCGVTSYDKTGRSVRELREGESLHNLGETSMDGLLVLHKDRLYPLQVVTYLPIHPR